MPAGPASSSSASAISASSAAPSAAPSAPNCASLLFLAQIWYHLTCRCCGVRPGCHVPAPAAKMALHLPWPSVECAAARTCSSASSGGVHRLTARFAFWALPSPAPPAWPGAAVRGGSGAALLGASRAMASRAATYMAPYVWSSLA